MGKLLKFRNDSFEFIHQMSDWCHQTLDEKEKKKLRSIKKEWLLLMYRNNLVDNLVYQISYSGDTLVWFHIGTRSFHLRKAHFNPGDIPTHPDIHQKQDTSHVDMGFVEKLPWIEENILRFS